MVHGPGPQGGPWTGSTGVVHGPGSMFCIRPARGRVQFQNIPIITSTNHSRIENSLIVELSTRKGLWKSQT